MGDDVAIEEVLDDRQICPTRVGHHIGDVRAPFLIGSFCLKVALQVMRVAMKILSLFGGAIRISLPYYRADAQLPHQAQDRFMVDLESFMRLEPDLDPSVSIGASTSQKSLFDKLHARQIRIWFSASPPPGVVGRSRDTEEVTHRVHSVFSPVLFNNPISRFASEP